MFGIIIGIIIVLLLLVPLFFITIKRFEVKVQKFTGTSPISLLNYLIDHDTLANREYIKIVRTVESVEDASMTFSKLIVISEDLNTNIIIGNRYIIKSHVENAEAHFIHLRDMYTGLMFNIAYEKPPPVVGTILMGAQPMVANTTRTLMILNDGQFSVTTGLKIKTEKPIVVNALPGTEYEIITQASSAATV